MDLVANRKVILVPGFCEPRWMLRPLAHRIRQEVPSVEIWRDRHLFRSLTTGAERLRAVLQRHAAPEQRLSVITHSFGDWTLRQALTGMVDHRVDHVISLAPVMRELPLAQIGWWCGLGFISEVPVMADRARAAEHLDLPPNIQRLVVWGKLDCLVPCAELPPDEHLNVHHVWATHLSIVLTPRVHDMVVTQIRRVPRITAAF